MKLLAGRTSQILNYQSLANDTGVDTKTIKNWLSVLEASFIIYKLCPYKEATMIYSGPTKKLSHNIGLIHFKQLVELFQG